jgi:Glycosyltransferases involved in cell wall biogenesis
MLISVALCTYNGARHLPAQLDSLLAQDVPELEIVVRDDASSDETWAILVEYAQRDARLRPYRNPRNLGFRANFEATLRNCRGVLVAPCDQDDVWQADKLSRLVTRLMERPRSLMAYCDSSLIDADGAPLGRRISDRLRMGDQNDPAAFTFVNCVSGHAMLFRRELLDHALPLPEGVFHDWWLAFVAAGLGGVVYEPAALIGYRQHGSAVTDFAGARRQADGYGLAKHADVQARLDAFAAWTKGQGSADGPFFGALAQRWRAARRQWISPRLVGLLWRHRHRLFAQQSDRRGRHARRALATFWGLRLKRWTQPRAYRE